MYDVTIPIYDDDLNLKKFFNHADAYDSIIVHFNYDPKRSATEFSTSTLEKYIQEIKRLCPDKEITYNVTYSLNEEYVVDTSECKQLEEVDNYLRNNFNTELFINDIGEDDYYTFGFRKTLSANRKLDEVAEKIKNATCDVEELSPFEKFMMAYEYVTQFEYNRELDSDDDSESRHWINVLEGDKIVCAGYTSLLQALCDRIFSPNEVNVFQQSLDVYVKNTSYSIGGHKSNLIYIKDNKYGIDGLFYVDPCWDSKKDKQEVERPSTSAFCCIPILDIIHHKKRALDFHFRSDHSIITDLYLLNNSQEYRGLLYNNNWKVEKSNLLNQFHSYCFFHLERCMNKLLPGFTISAKSKFYQKELENNLESFIKIINEKADNVVPMKAFVNSYKIIGKLNGFKGKELQEYVKQRIEATSKRMEENFEIKKCSNCFAKEIVKKRTNNK